MSIQEDIFREQHLGEIQKATLEGYIAGLEAFAWWKNGVLYVGTCGIPLVQAVAAARKAFELDRKANQC